jgi:hypothetical protein
LSSLSGEDRFYGRHLLASKDVANARPRSGLSATA